MASLMKYRADKADDPEPNGSIAWRTEWMHGPSLALVRKCPVDGAEKPRTVYVRGEPDLWFSIPAACRIQGRVRRGSLTHGDSGYSFTPHGG